MIFKNLRILLIGASTLFAFSAAAQDLLAHQAPIDKNMNSADILELQKIMSLEEYFSPENYSYIYNDWNNQYAHASGQIPDTFRINLTNFCMPTKSRKLTSNFGPRWGRQHKGLDIKVYTGDTIRSAFSGKVRVVRNEPSGYGRFIVIRHHNGLETVYGHLSRQLVYENQEVRAGDVIGLGGNTGRSTGSHLHFETRLCGVALNPAVLFDFYHQDVTCDCYVYTKNKYNRDAKEAYRRSASTMNNGNVNSFKHPEAGLERNSRTLAQASPSANSPSGQSNANKQNQTSVVKISDVSRDNMVVEEPVTGYHKVAAGETLYSIAKRRGTTVEDLEKKNHIGKDYKVIPGQILKY